MNQTILQTLFLDNLEISAEIVKFCNTIPEYVQAEREYNKAAQELMELIGYERYSEFESVLNSHLSNEVRAHYLFGLGLRRELLTSLTPPSPAGQSLPL